MQTQFIQIALIFYILIEKTRETNHYKLSMFTDNCFPKYKQND